MKTQWDLTMFYKSRNDPRIDKDRWEIQRAISRFNKDYKDTKAYLQDPKELLEVLNKYEKLSVKIMSQKPLLYLYCQKCLHRHDEQIETRFRELETKWKKINNKIAFFETNLGGANRKRQRQFLRDESLRRYRNYLRRVFVKAKHRLNPSEEYILSLKDLTSRAMWLRLTERLLRGQHIKYKKEDLSIAKAISILPELDTKTRHDMGKKIQKNLYSISHLVENELNAVVLNKKINDELRGHSKPYSQTVLENDNSEKEILTLVDIVTKNYAISHGFYKLKSKLLRLDKLQYSDRKALVGNIHQKFTFKKSINILRRVLSQLGKNYLNLLNKYLQNGQIDAFPKKDKTSSIFCIGAINLPTMILLNHTNSLRSLRILAHEMGHAIHTDFSKESPPLYQEYSLTTAETASTLFEDLVFNEILKDLSSKEKIIALCYKINEDVENIFGKISCFNFEYDLHTKIRDSGFLSKEEIANLMRQHLQKYLGIAFQIKESDGYSFVSASHIRNFFLSYTYAYGRLISRVLHENYKEDKSYLEKIEKFLRAGGSKSPKDICAHIDINTLDANIWRTALQLIEQDISKLESLTGNTL